MQNIKKHIFIVLCTLITFTFLACNSDTKNLPSNTTVDQNTLGDNSVENTLDLQGKKVILNLYFSNNDSSAVTMEAREVNVKEAAVIRAAIDALLAGPENKEYKRAIPIGTKLLGVKIEEDVATVDFSKEYNNANGIAEIIERASVVNTLTDIKGVNRVKILVEGEELLGPGGKPLGDMMKLVLDEKGYPIPAEIRKITLYFANSNADAIVSETREVEIKQGEAIEKIIFDELMKGPDSTELYPIIPQGTKLLSVETVDGICKLDLSHEFVDNSHVGTAGESMTLNSIVNSLTELSNVEKVQFLIDGQIREAYIHAIFDQPFERNEDIIKN